METGLYLWFSLILLIVCVMYIFMYVYVLCDNVNE